MHVLESMTLYNRECIHAEDTHLIRERGSDTTCRFKREGSNTYITVTPEGELKAIVRVQDTSVVNPTYISYTIIMALAV